MNNWCANLLAVIALVFPHESCADYYEDSFQDIKEIDPGQIFFMISNTSHFITLTLRVPNDSNPQCFKTEVQYKSQCAKDWKKGRSIKLKVEQEEHHWNLTALSMKTNYDFRIRMRYECLEKDWSDWTKVQSWGNNADACMVELPSYIWVYSLIFVLLLTIFLLVCLLTQQGIRKLFLPDVPDPKHLTNKIMDTDQCQWWGDLTQKNEECTATVIEIIDKSEKEEQHQTLVIQPIDTIPEQQDSMYCIYSPETSGENTGLQYSPSVLGYIVL